MPLLGSKAFAIICGFLLQHCGYLDNAPLASLADESIVLYFCSFQVLCTDKQS
jgi:hypothetical protein